jgi:hypothetical protein
MYYNIFIELIPNESICSIVTSECVVVGKDLGWKNNQNKSCRFQKVMQLYSSQFFLFEAILTPKYLIYKILWKVILKESICSIVISEYVVVVKDHRWRSTQNKSSKSRKVTQLCNWQLFIWNYLSNKNYIWILTLEIQKFQMTSDGETTKPKVVDLKKLCNFVVNFFIWNHLSNKKSCEYPHIWNLNFSNDLGWRNDQNKSCSSRKVIQLYSWRPFHLK